jgi:hypothetical protein
VLLALWKWVNRKKSNLYPMSMGSVKEDVVDVHTKEMRCHRKVSCGKFMGLGTMYLMSTSMVSACLP